jgi:hypothetical protein
MIPKRRAGWGGGGAQKNPNCHTPALFYDSFRFIKAWASDTATSGIHVCFEYNNDGLLVGGGNLRLAIYSFLFVNIKNSRVKPSVLMNFLFGRGMVCQSVSVGGFAWYCTQTYTHLLEPICEDFLNSTNRIGSTVVMETFYVSRWIIQ